MDTQRPQFHFLPPKNWMNDPNGLIQWQGTYHLFYQHNPNAAVWGDMHWGHARSQDLIHWRHLPMALTPDYSPDSPDRGGCFTGCALNWNGQPTFVYTGWTPERETVLLATSQDDLLTWQKHPANPVIASAPANMQTTGFRDPFLWREGAEYRMAIGSGIQGQGGAVLLYTSADLIHWEYRSILCQSLPEPLNGLDQGSMWECPNFLPVGENHLLIVSVMAKTQYTLALLGDYSGDHFTPHQAFKLDGGNISCYAPQVFQDERGRQIYFGWAWEARSQQAQVEAGWSGVMTLPRLIEPGGKHGFRVRPVPEVESLRAAPIGPHQFALSPAEDVILPDISGDSLELQLTIPLRENPLSGAVGLYVRQSPDGQERTEIRVDLENQLLIVDTSRSSLSPEAAPNRYELPLPLADTDVLTLRIFVDHSILEVYANEDAVITARMYPTRADSLGVALFSTQTVPKVEIRAWKMTSAFEE